MHYTPGYDEEMQIFKEKLAKLAPHIKINPMNSGDVLEFD
jgi:hypothetical protein